jgi:O-6-methylguanine DNA methyltransferase
MKEQIKSAILPELPIVGKLKISSRDLKSICAIEVVTDTPEEALDPFFSECFGQLEAYLNGKSEAFDLKLDLTGLTPFHQRVLKVMKSIPYGEAWSYKELAEKLNSKAYQAVGSACGRNPFMLIYPCHRVVGSHHLGGFAHGIQMKKKLLQLEKFKFQNFSSQ